MIPPTLIEKVAKVSIALDEANAKFANVEGLLKASGACITAWVKVDKYTSLGFTRFGKEFHICMNKGGEGSSGEHKPWMDWDREVKLLSVRRLDALIVSIEHQFDLLLEAANGVPRTFLKEPEFKDFVRELSVRCRKAMYRLKIESLEQLEKMDPRDFASAKNVGNFTVRQMKKLFQEAYQRELWPGYSP